MCPLVKQLIASGVNRFKICAYESGSGSLSLAQQTSIRAALQAEAERLLSIQIESGQLPFELGLHDNPGFDECGGVSPC